MVDQGPPPSGSLDTVCGEKGLHLDRHKLCHGQRMSLGPFICHYRRTLRFPPWPVKRDGHFQKWFRESGVPAGLPKFGWGRAVRGTAADHPETETPGSTT